MDIYKKYCLHFQPTQGSFCLLSCFAIYRMVDSEYNMDLYKSVKIRTGPVMRNPEMLLITWSLVPDHLKTKTMCKHAVKNLLFVIWYVSDWYKIQKICDESVLENGGTLESWLLQKS